MKPMFDAFAETANAFEATVLVRLLVTTGLISPFMGAAPGSG